MFGRKSNSEKSPEKPDSDNKSSGLQNLTSFLKRDSTPEPIDETPEVSTDLHFEPDHPKPSNSKSVRLIQEVQKIDDKTINFLNLIQKPP